MNIIDDSYRSISESLKFKTCLPYDPDWSAAPDFLKLIIDYCLEVKPKTIVECSSGITTLVLARCCQLNNIGHVYSLENGEEYVRSTMKQLVEFELDEYADVIHAPLKNIQVNDQLYDWYQVDHISLSEVDMLVVDGPSGFIQKNSRYPALPLMFDRFANDCAMFLDDANRVDEKEIVGHWLNEYPVLKHRYIENNRGCSILRLMP